MKGSQIPQFQGHLGGKRMTLKIINGSIPNFDTMALEKKDILIDDGKIIWIGSHGEDIPLKNLAPNALRSQSESFFEDIKEIDASNKIVSPGFIDIHMHEETFENHVKESPKLDEYYASYYELKMGVTTCVAGNCGNNRQSVKDFKNYIEKEGAPVNYMTFIGHNYLRNLVGISDRYRAANDKEIALMQSEIKTNLEHGIIGLSFGIEYSPGITFDEMIKLTQAFSNKRYLLSAHFRKDAEGAYASIEELVELSKVTGHPMQVSHIGSCSAYGDMKSSLALIEKSRAEGLDIMADCYPYDAFATYIGSAVFDEGCFDRWQRDYSAILLTEEPYKNTRCDEKLFYQVRKSHPDMIAAAFVMNETEVVEALKAPFVFVGSDSLYKKDQGHPRGAGTFPRVLSKYVRENNQIDMMTALWKMTAGPAMRLNLVNKGRIEVGKDADLVIFDAESIQDHASFSEPTQAPSGIEYVILNGKIAVKANQIIDGRLGKYISYKPIVHA